jgi:hypothetical protein
MVDPEAGDAPLDTPIFAPVQSILIVEEEGPARAWCAEVSPGIAILWSATTAAARERILATHPLVIVAPDRDRDELDLAEIAESTGAAVVRFVTAHGRSWFQDRLREALAEAEQRRREKSIG